MPTQRNEVLDGLKFLLIILVAVGHFSEPYRYTHTIVLGGYSVIYLFHMPLFILLIGYMIALLYNRENEMCIFSKRNVHFLYFFRGFPARS